MMMERVAAIDCGTNSIRLLIADVPRSSHPHTNAGARDMVDVHRDMVITRLGQGVDKTGLLHPEAIARTLAAATVFQARIEDSGVASLRIAATSATRDAANRSEFVEGMTAITGVEPEVITGREEAELSFIGSISSLPGSLDAPFMIVDIGGGSTEFVLGEQTVRQSVSVNMGSVRVTERFGPEPWDASKQKAARTWIDERIREAAESVDLRSAKTVVGVAGTVTSLAGWVYGVQRYTPEVTHGSSPSADQWREALDFMINASVEHKAQVPAMPPGRADVIGGGALIWERILQYVGVLDGYGDVAPKVVVSEHDLLDGLALSQVAH